MLAKIITNTLFIFALGTLQIAFISGLPGWLSYLNLVLVVLIFILGFSSFNFAIWWSVGAGLMLEFFSFSSFGAYLIGLSLTVVIANFLLNYFFTNRSLYSFLALIFLATLAYELIISSIYLFFVQADKYFFLVNLNFWSLVYKQISLNLVFTVFIYYLIYFLGRSFKPVFLIKGNKY